MSHSEVWINIKLTPYEHICAVLMQSNWTRVQFRVWFRVQFFDTTFRRSSKHLNLFKSFGNLRHCLHKNYQPFCKNHSVSGNHHLGGFKLELAISYRLYDGDWEQPIRVHARHIILKTNLRTFSWYPLVAKAGSDFPYESWN